MRKKGFTLIELLAVIVILAIIALIATPIVMNIINNVKKSAAVRSAESYMTAVETAASAARVDFKKVEGTYIIKKDGNICPLAGCGSKDKDKVIVDIGINKPTGGTVVIESGEVVAHSTTTEAATSIILGNYTVSYNNTNEEYEAIDYIPIQQIIIEYPTAYYEKDGETITNAMTTIKDYEPKITILPENATNKKLEFSIYLYSGAKDIIDPNTGVITHIDPPEYAFGRCTSVIVTAKALDGSGVNGKITLSTKTPDVSKCWSSSPWH